MQNELDYTLVRRKRLKYWRIVVRKDGVIVVTVGKTASKKEISKFIESRRKWIGKVLSDVEEKKGRISEIESTRSGQLLHMGEWYRVIFEMDLFSGIHLDDINYTVTVNVNKGDAQESLDKWQKEQVRQVVEGIADRIGRVLGVEYNKIYIRGQKSRWGCCSPDRNISINWRLIRAPYEVLEYIVIHEMCHIKESSHSRKYWTLVECLLPDYRDTEQWLEDNSGMLYLNTVNV